MASHVVALADHLPLAERLQAAQLPPPDECRAIRESAGATLRELATEIGVTASAVQRWESGPCRIRRHHAIAYRRVLDSLRGVAA